MNSSSSIISFLIVKDIAVWQGIFWSSIFIPIVITISHYLKKWWNNKKPLNSLLRGYKDTEQEILVFLAQLSQADNTHTKVTSPRYVQLYPKPIPTNHNNLAKIVNINIDPVWPETDGLCVADIFNVLGRAGMAKNIRVAHLIHDWNQRSSPIFTVGFNAKTIDLIDECEPVYFKLHRNITLSIEGSHSNLDSEYPNDASIIQKTYIKGTKTPVFILAGLGTAGTTTAGYFFAKNCVELGRLYENKAFCLLLNTNICKGKNYYEIIAVYPKPQFKIAHPFTYFKWKKMKIFPD